MLPTQKILKAMRKPCMQGFASSAAVRMPSGSLSIVNKAAPLATPVPSRFLSSISGHSKVEFDDSDSPSAYSKMFVKSVPEHLYDDLEPKYHQSLMSLVRNSKDTELFKWVGLGRSVSCCIDSNPWKWSTTKFFRTLMIVDLGDGGYQVRYGVTKFSPSEADLSDIFARLPHCDMVVRGGSYDTASAAISTIDFQDWDSALPYIKERFDDMPQDDRRIAKSDASWRTTACNGMNDRTTNLLLQAKVGQEVLRKYLQGNHDEKGYNSGYLDSFHHKVLMNHAYCRYFFAKQGIRSPSNFEMLKWSVLTLVPSYFDCEMEDCYPTPRIEGIRHLVRKQPPLPLQGPEEKNSRPRN